MKITAFILVSATLFVYLEACIHLRSGVTSWESKNIIEKHNSLRDLIAQGRTLGQPRGTNFQHMKWDEKLARAAQKITNSCEFKRKPVCDGRWFGVGQNLYSTMCSSEATAPEWDRAIQAWFDEHFDYMYPQNPSYNTSAYTQLVWADSNVVGCGYTAYKKGEWFKQLYVCNYGPAGNIPGRPPYQLAY